MKKSMNKKLISILLAASMLTLVSCGDDDDDDDNNNAGVPQQQQQAQGLYRATLIPSNPTHWNTTGTVEVRLDNDEFTADVNVTGAPAGMHMQHIHLGTQCAPATADTNTDGYIDAQEASPFAGPMVIPFDSNLYAQDLGENEYPMGSSYQYSESASWDTLMTDLRLPDLDTGDSLIKLSDDNEFLVEGRVVEIHGVPESTIFPATVQSIDSHPAHHTMPIACGILTRVQEETDPSQTTGGATDGTTGGTTTGGTTTGSF
jgi:hypothetical protein